MFGCVLDTPLKTNFIRMENQSIQHKRTINQIIGATNALHTQDVHSLHI